MAKKRTAKEQRKFCLDTLRLNLRLACMELAGELLPPDTAYAVVRKASHRMSLAALAELRPFMPASSSPSGPPPADSPS